MWAGGLTKLFLKPFLGMSVADKSSYFSRFTIKLVEMVAAGIATAVSGYLVAHLGGYLFSAAPAPATVQLAPTTGGTSKAASTRARAQPAREASADAGEKRHASAPDAGSPTAPVRTTATAAPAAASRKPAATDTSAAASNASDEDTVEAQVRAALANVDASRPAASPPAAPLHQADAPPAPVAVAAPPADTAAGAGAVEVAPRTADLAPQPVQQTPVQPDPLTTVEIKSRPVADVGALPAAAPDQKDAQENTQQENTQDDSGLLSAIKHIPDLLRASSSASDGDPPRPPRPVGN